MDWMTRRSRFDPRWNPRVELLNMFWYLSRKKPWITYEGCELQQYVNLLWNVNLLKGDILDVQRKDQL
jgi:hypothetical protein